MDPFSCWPNLAAMMLALGQERGPRIMHRYFRDGGWHSLSWGDFATRTASLAQALQSLLAPGARVLLVSDSRPEVVMANVALQAIGAVPVPAYVTNLPADHAHLLADSGARAAIVANPALAQRVLAGAAMAGGLDLLICMDAGAADLHAPCTVLAWDSLVARTSALATIRAAAEMIDRDDIACLMYTSGTGGAPKGVSLPHRSILSNCIGASDIVAPLKLTDETYLSILPLSHSYEYTAGQFFLSAIGCEVVFARGVETLASDMKTIRPHIMTVVPRVLDVVRGRALAEIGRGPAWKRRLFNAALNSGLRRLDRARRPLDRLLDPLLDRLVRAKLRARFGGRIVAMVSGGARLDPDVGRFFLAMGLPVLQGYGQTEAGPVISCNPPGDIRVETVGPPLRGVELRLAEDGEILVRGDLVMAGYWNRPADTDATIAGGWLHTGDIGTLQDGYLRITDRKKDLIVLSGGENISPARIEGLLMAEAAIAQAVVAGDGQTGLVAYLVPTEGAEPVAVAACLLAVNRRLGGAEKIRRHQLVEAFTLDNGLLTATQKIRRRLVIDRFSG